MKPDLRQLRSSPLIRSAGRSPVQRQEHRAAALLQAKPATAAALKARFSDIRRA